MESKIDQITNQIILNSKLQKQEMTKLKESISKRQTKTIFNDMQELYNHSMVAFVQRLELQKKEVLEVIEKTSRDQRLALTAIDKKYNALVQTKLGNLERAVETVIID